MLDVLNIKQTAISIPRRYKNICFNIFRKVSQNNDHCHSDVNKDPCSTVSFIKTNGEKKKHLKFCSEPKNTEC